MARRTEGFADGFQGGFGLINDFYATKAKQKSDEDMMDYRQEELGLRREGQEQAATAAAEALKVRGEEREYRRQELERGDAYRLEQRDLAAQEKTARLEAKVVNDEFNTARLAGLESERKIAEGRLAAQERATKIEEKQALTLRNGIHAQNLTDLADAGDHAAMLQYLKDQGDDIFNPGSMLNIPDHLNIRNDKYNLALLEDLKAVAGGSLNKEGWKLSDESLAAISTMINQDRKSHIGEVIGTKHVNAPKSFHGMTIVDSGISDAQTGMRTGEADEDGVVDGNAGEFKLTFTAWVKAKDSNGASHYYTAPATNYGDVSKSTAAGITMDEGTQALSGMVGLSAHLNQNPLVRSSVEEAIKIKKFGSPKEFEEFVSSEVKAVFDKFEGVTKDIPVENYDELSSLGFTGMGVGELLSERTELTNKIREHALYGPSAVSGIQAARRYEERIVAGVPTLTYESDATQTNKMGKRNNTGNIGDLVLGGVDAITPQMALEINQMGDSTVLKGENLDRLIKYLDDNNMLAERKVRKKYAYYGPLSRD